MGWLNQMVKPTTAWELHGGLFHEKNTLALSKLLQVSCGWYDLPFHILTSPILPHALSLEMESKLFLLQIPLNIFPRATLPARVTWRSSLLQSPPLSSVSTGVSTQLPQRCSKMLASANQPGPTMSRSTLPLGTATNHTWCVYFKGVYFIHWHRSEFYLVTSFTTPAARLSRWTKWSTWYSGR